MVQALQILILMQNWRIFFIFFFVKEETEREEREREIRHCNCCLVLQPFSGLLAASTTGALQMGWVFFLKNLFCYFFLPYNCLASLFSMLCFPASQNFVMFWHSLQHDASSCRDKFKGINLKNRCKCMLNDRDGL